MKIRIKPKKDDYILYAGNGREDALITYGTDYQAIKKVYDRLCDAWRDDRQSPNMILTIRQRDTVTDTITLNREVT